MPPALRFPVQFDMKSFRDQAKQLNDGVNDTLKLTGQAFKRINGEMLGIARETAGGVALGWSQAATRQVLAFTAAAGGIVAAYKLVGAAIDQTREQIERMAECFVEET